MNYLVELEGMANDRLPPVQSWNPERTGEIDIVIKRDGSWLHDGAPIKRARLARLFSRILRKDGDAHFLVTPYEKLKIVVEDAPFVAVLLRAEGAGHEQKLVFTTNLGDVVLAGAEHAIMMREVDGNPHTIPYIDVRDGLLARINRTVYYELVALSEKEDTDASVVYTVRSNGETFVLGAAE
ncbi:MAG: DUF1285 domain-containing protein [Marinicaulis sp.]|nr:DUF1285 domain-containing protein [Marinicaulis sp.]